MFQRLAESSPQDFARAVLLGLIAVSWTVVIGVGGWLIVKTYGDDVRDRPPLVEQTLSVLNVLEVSPPELREDILLTRDSNYFDVTLIPNQAPASPDNSRWSISRLFRRTLGLEKPTLPSGCTHLSEYNSDPGSMSGSSSISNSILVNAIHLQKQFVLA